MRFGTTCQDEGSAQKRIPEMIVQAQVRPLVLTINSIRRLRMLHLSYEARSAAFT